MTRAAAPAYRAPAGFWPIDARWSHATVAGSSLHCAGCGTTGHAPLPKEPGYSAAVETFLQEHKRHEPGPEADS